MGRRTVDAIKVRTGGRIPLNRDTAAPIGFTAVAAVCGIKAAESFNGFGELGPAALVVAGGVACGWVVVRVLTAPARFGHLAGHSHGGTRERVAIHEAAHYVAATAVGGRPKSAVLYRDGGGYVKWTGTTGTNREQVVAAVAFLDAGRQALGSREGCSGDSNSIKATLRFLPRRDRPTARREGEAWAGRIVTAHRSHISAVATRLEKKRRIR